MNIKTCEHGRAFECTDCTDESISKMGSGPTLLQIKDKRIVELHRMLELCQLMFRNIGNQEDPLNYMGGLRDNCRWQADQIQQLLNLKRGE